MASIIILVAFGLILFLPCVVARFCANGPEEEVASSHTVQLAEQMEVDPQPAAFLSEPAAVAIRKPAGGEPQAKDSVRAEQDEEAKKRQLRELAPGAPCIASPRLALRTPAEFEDTEETAQPSAGQRKKKSYEVQIQRAEMEVLRSQAVAARAQAEALAAVAHAALVRAEAGAELADQAEADAAVTLREIRRVA